MHIGGYILDSRQNLLRAQGAEIALSPLAVRFLEHMGQAPGEVVARTALIDALWRGDWLVGNAALNRLVSEVRRALGDDPRDPKLIQTVPRCGYRLIAEPGEAEAIFLPDAQINGHPPVPGAEPSVAVPMPRSERMTWRQMWTMVNYTILSLGCSIGLIMTIGIFAHH